MNANMSPHFSLDGRKIVFSSLRSGTEQLYLMNADGSHVIRLTNPPGTNFNPVFIP
jgi:TolB protein